MRLNELSPAPGSKKKRKRLGRGVGSGYGKTSGRGQKGAGARSGNGQTSTYEGGQMPLQRRVPRLRGTARNWRGPAHPVKYQAVNVGELEEVSGETIGVEEIRSAGLVGKKGNVKVLGDGEIGRAIDVKAHAFSRSAREKIEAAGGSVETIGE